MQLAIPTLALSLLGASLSAQNKTRDSIPSSIWRDTARVNAAVRIARQVYADVSAAANANRLTVSDTTVDCEEGDGGEDQFKIFTDSTKVVRKLTWEGGSGDVSLETEYYYDSVGKLRFTFQSAGHVPNWHWTSRWYYDGTGTLVKRVDEIEKGHAFKQPQLSAPDPWKFVRDFCKPD